MYNLQRNLTRRFILSIRFQHYFVWNLIFLGSEFDHDDVAYAMSVEYGLEEEEEKKRRSCTGNNQSLDKDENMNIDGIKDEDKSSPMDDFYDQR